jgi:rare lipoprotein A
MFYPFRQRSALCPVVWPALLLALLAAAGCAHHRDTAQLPPPQTLPPPPQACPAPPRSTPQAPAQLPPAGISAEDLDYVATHNPIFTEMGLATWYTAPYKGRRAANGQVFDDRAMTAAHRTLPLGSLVVVTNLKTGESGAMRITDRGPFVLGRIVDLTIASAKATGVYRAGLARVRVDVYQTPKPIETGGRWCVQIGAFKSEETANGFKDRLQRRYPRSTVIEFAGQNSYWVRIRPAGDNREQAEFLARNLHPAEGEAFLTRLD